MFSGASASEELDFDGKENVAAEKHAGVGLHVGRGLVTLRLSTASISVKVLSNCFETSSESQVLLCLVVCLAAVLFCLQSRYDGDYLGGVDTFKDNVNFYPQKNETQILS